MGSDSPEKGNGKKSADKSLIPDRFPAELIAELPQAVKLKTTLYDVAQHSLSRRALKTGESQKQDQIYFELNRIMQINGYPDAKLDGRRKISDINLPSDWNNVKTDQQFKLYDKASVSTEAVTNVLRESLRKQIVEETSTIPVKPTQGYYQVLEEMKPHQEARERAKEAHRLKEINGGREVLIVGERLPTATEAERTHLLEQRLLDREKNKAKEEDKEKQKANEKSQDLGPEKGPKKGETKAPDSGTQADTDQPKAKADAKADRDSKADGNKKAVELPSADVKDAAAERVRAAQQAMKDEVSRLSGEYMSSEKVLQQSLAKQGLIGNAFDAAKNNIGSSGEGKSWYEPGKLWSGIFDKDLGSTKIKASLLAEKDQLTGLKKAADAGDTASFSQLHKEITGKDFAADKVAFSSPAARPAQDHLTAHSLAQNFDRSQQSGVGTITDIGAGVAAMAALRYGKEGSLLGLAKASGAGFLIGGSTKATLMQVDGAYGSFGRDFATGGLLGATVPIAELGGAKLSTYVGKKLGLTVTGDFFSARIETEGTGLGRKLLSASLKSGTSGGVFGSIESPGREVIDKIDQGEKISLPHLVETSVKGSALGFLGGTLLGFSADGLSSGFRKLHPSQFKVDIKSTASAEGGLSLDQAAQKLSLSTEALSKKAIENPYAAVQDAVKLYEKSGQNIKSNNLVTGHAPLPEAFDNALKLSQKVDVLTSESPVKLAQKVEIIQSVDQYLQADSKSVDAAFTRVADSPEYQKLLKLKEAEAGGQTADAFTSKMRSSFDEEVNDKKLANKEAVDATIAKTEENFKQKVADYFKDMTDPLQRERLNKLVGEIDQKFNPELISLRDLSKILDGYQGKEREIALALLQESTGTASDVQLRNRLQSLKGELETKLGTATPDVYTLQAGSSGNALGYLYRKSISSSMSIRNLDQLEGASIPSRVVLFDDLTSTPISAAQKQFLQKISQVYVVDLGAFEKSVNVLDLAGGAAGVQAKLATLMAEARQISAKNPSLLPSAVAKELLSGSVDEAARAIGANVKIIRPPSSGSTLLNLAKAAETAAGEMETLHAGLNAPRASREEIAKFLSAYVGEERELAARMLAEGATHNSFAEMARKVLVTDRDPGGSTHLISYLFGKVNGLSAENFVSTKQLNNLITTGGAKNKAVAYFDDTIYSGSQTKSMLDGNIPSLSPFKRIIVASLGAYEKGISNINGTHLAGLGKVDVNTAAMHEPFYSNKNPFFAKISPQAQYAVKNIGGTEGFGSVQGSIIWSYMYPDNNLNFFGSKFSGGTLKLPGP